MLELFYAPGACSLAAHIALEESGCEYAAHRLSLADGEHRSKEFLAINPRARVPVLREGDWTLTENPAILSYIARRHLPSRLLPENTQTAASCEAFLSYCASSVHIAFAQVWRGERFTDDAALHAALKRGGLDNLQKYFPEIETRVRAQWMFAPHFTIGDLYPLVFYRWGIRIGKDMSIYPNWTAHTERVLARPAVQRVMRREQISMGPPGAAA